MISPEQFEIMTVEQRARYFDARPFGALGPDHGLVGKTCFLCKNVFKAGEHLTAIVLDSEANLEAAAQAAGSAYTAEATSVHWTCLTGSDDPQGDWERWYHRDGAED